MFCNNCGAPLVPNAAFCSKCGAPIAGQVQPAAPPVANPWKRRPTSVIVGCVAMLGLLGVLTILVVRAIVAPSGNGSSSAEATGLAGRITTAANATATARAFEQYPTLDVREMIQNSAKYRNQPVKLQGEVFQIEEQSGRTALQIWDDVPGEEGDTEAVMVRYDAPLPGVFKDSDIVVYGLGAGEMTGENAFGAKISQPLISTQQITR